MKKTILYYAISMLMSIYFERAVLRYEHSMSAIESRGPRQAIYQIEQSTEPR
jgi:hypothetical protein